MTITITDRKTATDPGFQNLGFVTSAILIDGFQIGIVIWPVNDVDYGMLELAGDGRLRLPGVHPGRKPRPYVRFGLAPSKPVDGWYAEIVQTVKDELDDDYRASVIAKMLIRMPPDYTAGFLCAMEGPYCQAECSATAVRVAIRNAYDDHGRLLL